MVDAEDEQVVLLVAVLRLSIRHRQEVAAVGERNGHAIGHVEGAREAIERMVQADLAAGRGGDDRLVRPDVIVCEGNVKIVQI